MLAGDACVFVCVPFVETGMLNKPGGRQFLFSRPGGKARNTLARVQASAGARLCFQDGNGILIQDKILEKRSGAFAVGVVLAQDHGFRLSNLEDGCADFADFGWLNAMRESLLEIGVEQARFPVGAQGKIHAQDYIAVFICCIENAGAVGEPAIGGAYFY